MGETRHAELGCRCKKRHAFGLLRKASSAGVKPSMGNMRDSRNLRINDLCGGISKRFSDQRAETLEVVMASKVVSRHRASTETRAVGEWRNGKMTVMVPVSEAELDWLVAKKYLAEKERENKVAIKQAIESHLSAAAKAAAV
jgi:hypothetical protein